VLQFAPNRSTVSVTEQLHPCFICSEQSLRPGGQRSCYFHLLSHTRYLHPARSWSKASPDNLWLVRLCGPPWLEKMRWRQKLGLFCVGQHLHDLTGIWRENYSIFVQNFIENQMFVFLIIWQRKQLFPHDGWAGAVSAMGEVGSRPGRNLWKGAPCTRGRKKKYLIIQFQLAPGGATVWVFLVPTICS